MTSPLDHVDAGVVFLRRLVGGVPVDIDDANPLPVSGAGGGGSTTTKATAADPAYVEGSTTNPVSVDLSGYQRALIKAVALPLPTGAATDATLGGKLDTLHADLSSNHADEVQLHTDIVTTLHADLNGVTGKLPATLGQKTAAASMSVVLSSDGPFATNFGLQADAAQTDQTQSASHISFLKGLLASVKSLIVLAAGANIIGKVGVDQTTPGTTNGVVVNSGAGTLQETTIAVGATAQDLFSAATPGNGYEIVNPHASEILYFREASDAAVAGASSIPIAAGGSYVTPQGYKPTGRVSVIATTAGHGLVARRW